MSRMPKAAILQRRSGDSLSGCLPIIIVEYSEHYMCRHRHMMKGHAKETENSKEAKKQRRGLGCGLSHTLAP